MARFMMALVSMIAFSTSAYAQDDGREIKYKERTEIDFEGVDVTGELVKPQGQLLIGGRKASFNPLIKLRENFNAEMRSSVDQIK